MKTIYFSNSQDSNGIKSVSVSSFGGKGASLVALQKLAFRVPAFALISVEEISSWPNGKIPPSVVDRLKTYFPEDATVAVRSSAVAEDGVQHSFAGQFETQLFVKWNELPLAVERVLASARSEKIRSYQEQRQLESSTSTLALVVQEMVESEVSGVAFKIHPVTGNRKQTVVNAVWGLGEGLVSAELNADEYIISEREILRTVADKVSRYVARSNGSGTEVESVPENLRTRACLSDSQLREIDAALSQLYIHRGQYMDVEFAYAKNQLYVLQARPITTAKTLADTSDHAVVWDNSNIVESYPGLTSSLTFSFIQKMYESVYRQFCSLLGVEEWLIEKNASVFAHMLGLIRGRVYYNLPNWYKALALLPGYKSNAAFMESMMGVKERFEVDPNSTQGTRSEFSRIFRTAGGLITRLIRLKSDSRKFQSELQKTLDEYASRDFDRMNSTELVSLYEDFEKTLFKKWKPPLVNDFFAMIFFGLLKKTTVRYGLDQGNPAIVNELLAGSADIVSTVPIDEGLKISESIQNDLACQNIFLHESAASIWFQLQEGKFPEIKRKIDAFVQTWGDRCVGELKLETVTYKTDPILYLEILKSYVRAKLTRQSFSKRQVENLRAGAEARVRKTLRGKPIRSLIFSFLLKRTRYLVSQRENLRFERTRGFAVVRSVFRSLGRRWKAEGIIEELEDIFYLTLSEIQNVVRASHPDAEISDLIRLRKKSYALYQGEQPSPRLKTFGLFSLGNSFVQEAKKNLDDGDLKGIPCCAGKVKARVKLVSSPHEVRDLEGCILVTVSTDPGWAPLFPSCAGILVERGSLLSHSAIVSRELGIPCIVGIDGLWNRLTDGELVEMDGSTGFVQRIDHD